MKQDFIIPLNGLAQGRTEFRARADKEFFEEFENRDILEAGVDVDIVVEKSGNYIGVDCTLDGAVTVMCDRCLENLVLPVRESAFFSVKFGAEPSGGDSPEGGREIIFLPESDAELDMSQIVYDYICLSLPIQRVHEEGECDPDTVRFLSRDGGEDEPASDNPFAGLKDLLKN